jgi:hypothetical protein
MFSLGALKLLLGSGWALSCAIVKGNRPTDGQGNFRNRLWGTSSLGEGLVLPGPPRASFPEARSAPDCREKHVGGT